MAKMKAISVDRAGYGGNNRAKPPRMVIKSTDGKKISVYRSPLETSHTGDGQEWSESERVGRQAVMRRAAEKVPSYSFKIVLGHADYYKEVGNDIKKFIAMARSKSPVVVVYSKLESGTFYITDFTYDVELRSPFTNEPTRANISITFTKAISSAVKTGPIAKVKAKPKPKPVKKAKPKKPTRKYKVKKGDTLWDLAQKYYGNPYKWPKIADKNGVRNPRRLQIGHVLTIPYL